MAIVVLCQRMGWDYWTYLSQPTWFVDLLMEKMNIDAKKEKDMEKQQQLRHR